MSDARSKGLLHPPASFPEAVGFGKPRGPLSPPLRQANTAVSREFDVLLAADPSQHRAKESPDSDGPNLEREVKRFAARLRRRYAEQIQRDPRGFKKRVCSLSRRYLPPYAGRPMEETINRAAELRRQDRGWKEIYPLVIPDHSQLEPAVRRQAESNLRAAVRSRRNARRQRRRGKRYLATAGPQPSRPASAPTGPSAAGASGAGG